MRGFLGKQGSSTIVFLSKLSYTPTSQPSGINSLQNLAVSKLSISIKLYVSTYIHRRFYRGEWNGMMMECELTCVRRDEGKS